MKKHQTQWIPALELRAVLEEDCLVHPHLRKMDKSLVRKSKDGQGHDITIAHRSGVQQLLDNGVWRFRQQTVSDLQHLQAFFDKYELHPPLQVTPEMRELAITTARAYEAYQAALEIRREVTTFHTDPTLQATIIAGTDPQVSLPTREAVDGAIAGVETARKLFQDARSALTTTALKVNPQHKTPIPATHETSFYGPRSALLAELNGRLDGFIRKVVKKENLRQARIQLPDENYYSTGICRA